MAKVDGKALRGKTRAKKAAPKKVVAKKAVPKKAAVKSRNQKAQYTKDGKRKMVLGGFTSSGPREQNFGAGRVGGAGREGGGGTGVQKNYTANYSAGKVGGNSGGGNKQSNVSAARAPAQVTRESSPPSAKAAAPKQASVIDTIQSFVRASGAAAKAKKEANARKAGLSSMAGASGMSFTGRPASNQNVIADFSSPTHVIDLSTGQRTPLSEISSTKKIQERIAPQKKQFQDRIPPQRQFPTGASGMSFTPSIPRPRQFPASGATGMGYTPAPQTQRPRQFPTGASGMSFNRPDTSGMVASAAQRPTPAVFDAELRNQALNAAVRNISDRYKSGRLSFEETAGALKPFDNAVKLSTTGKKDLAAFEEANPRFRKVGTYDQPTLGDLRNAVDLGIITDPSVVKQVKDASWVPNAYKVPLAGYKDPRALARIANKANAGRAAYDERMASQAAPVAPAGVTYNPRAGYTANKGSQEYTPTPAAGRGYNPRFAYNANKGSQDYGQKIFTDRLPGMTGPTEAPIFTPPPVINDTPPSIKKDEQRLGGVEGATPPPSYTPPPNVVAPKNTQQKSLDKMSFSKAFAAARDEKGAGDTFSWRGKEYSTNLASEAGGRSGGKKRRTARDKGERKYITNFSARNRGMSEGGLVRGDGKARSGKTRGRYI